MDWILVICEEIHFLFLGFQVLVVVIIIVKIYNIILFVYELDFKSLFLVSCFLFLFLVFVSCFLFLFLVSCFLF